MTSPKVQPDVSHQVERMRLKTENLRLRARMHSADVTPVANTDVNRIELKKFQNYFPVKDNPNNIQNSPLPSPNHDRKEKAISIPKVKMASNSTNNSRFNSRVGTRKHTP